jgi:hypothetical protein
LRKWAGCHGLIVSRVDVPSQYLHEIVSCRSNRISTDVSRPAFRGLT